MGYKGDVLGPSPKGNFENHRARQYKAAAMDQGDSQRLLAVNFLEAGDHSGECSGNRSDEQCKDKPVFYSPVEKSQQYAGG